MRWPRFLFFNSAGAVLWASLYGIGAYYLGEEVVRFAKPVAIGIGVAAAALTIAAALFLHRHETQLEDEAEAALPGPLRPLNKRRLR